MNTTTHSQTHTVSAPASAEVPTMRAIVQDRYGSSETWMLREIERPDIKPNEVLLQVHAAGLDRGTWHEMTGRPHLNTAVAMPRHVVGRIDWSFTG